MKRFLAPTPNMTRRSLLQWGGYALAFPSAIVHAEPPQRKITPPRPLLQWGKRGKAEGEFDILIGMAINRKDEVLVTEFRNNRVQKFNTEGKFLASFPVPEYPGGIAVDKKGNIYVAHMLSGKITVFDEKGKQLHEWGGNGTDPGLFQQPGGIAVAPNGTLYIADQVNRRVQQLTPEGKFIRAWGEYGVAPGQFGGNTPRPNRVGGPHFIALDRHGNVYTTEGSVGRIQKFTPEGKYILSWGDNGTEPGGFGGRPNNLPGPIAIALDKHGDVWVSATNHLVQQYTPEGAFLQAIGGKGEALGQFHTPHALEFDSKGSLYVCDSQNARIQKFAPS